MEKFRKLFNVFGGYLCDKCEKQGKYSSALILKDWNNTYEIPTCEECEDYICKKCMHPKKGEYDDTLCHECYKKFLKIK